MKWTGHILRMSDNKTVKYSGGNQAAGDHEEGQRSTGWTVWKKIFIEQEYQDITSQPADNVYHSRRQKSMEGVGGIDN